MMWKKASKRRSAKRGAHKKTGAPDRRGPYASAFEQKAQKRDHRENADPEKAELSRAARASFIVFRDVMVVI